MSKLHLCEDDEGEFNDDSDDLGDLDLSLEMPEGIEKMAIADMINALIVDEFESIDKYNSTIATLSMSEGMDSVIKILNDIIDEENVHVGQLQEVLRLVSPSADKIDDGRDEAKEIIDDKTEEKI